MSDALWGPVDPAAWRSTSHTSGRPATEEDVTLGRAVFFVPPLEGHLAGSTPYRLELPCLATLLHEDGAVHMEVVVVQAEQVDHKVLVGYRPFTGGNGIALLHELRFPECDIR